MTDYNAFYVVKDKESGERKVPLHIHAHLDPDRARVRNKKTLCCVGATVRRANGLQLVMGSVCGDCQVRFDEIEEMAQ